jgi:hypothetical protein
MRKERSRKRIQIECNKRFYVNNAIREIQHCRFCQKVVATWEEEVKNSEKTALLLENSVHNFAFVDAKNSIIKLIKNNKIDGEMGKKEIDSAIKKCVLLCKDCITAPSSES